MNELLKKANQWWKNATPKQRGTALVALIGVICTGLFLLFTSIYQPASTAVTATAATDKLDDPLYYFGVVAKTIAVMMLIVGGAIVLKRYQGSQPGGRPDRVLTVIESARLSPKQALHVVRAGGQYFLVGATDQSIHLLSQVQLENVTAEEQPLPVKRFSFEAVLARANGLTMQETESVPAQEQDGGGLS